MSDINYEKTGYLNSPFRLFHITESEIKQYDGHYHDFHKILLFLSGDVDYFIEGTSYPLKPQDIVLIKAGEVHRPVIRSSSPYERIILYISPDFLASFQGVSSTGEAYSLENCFMRSPALHDSASVSGKKKTKLFPVLRSSSSSIYGLFQLAVKLEQSLNSNEYASEIYSQALFLEFLVQLNRSILTDSFHYIETGSSNQKILEILHYINKHLEDDLTIEVLSKRFFISRRHLIYLFQQETGYSIGKYINAKRLFLARDNIRHGMSLTDACYASGFKHYSTFTRSYYRMFQTTPGAFKKEL